MRLQLARRTRRSQLRELTDSLRQTIKLISRSASLAQHLHLSRSQHIPVGHRQPQPLPRRLQATRRPLVGHTDILSNIIQKTTLSMPKTDISGLARPRSEPTQKNGKRENPRGGVSQVRNTSAVEMGRPPGSGVSKSPRGRFWSVPPEISVADPPPSRLIASRQPMAAISRASSASVRPASWRERPSLTTA